jgi:hypothetical protein
MVVEHERVLVYIFGDFLEYLQLSDWLSIDFWSKSGACLDFSSEKAVQTKK